MRTYLRQRRQLLWWLTALALFFAAYFALRTDRTAMNRLCGSVIFPAMRQAARLCDGFDGSVGEVLILTAIWAGIIWLACTVRRLIAGPRRRAVPGGFRADRRLPDVDGVRRLSASCGARRTAPTAFRTGAAWWAQPVSVEELEQVTRYFASELTAAADGVPRDASGVCAADRKTILAAAGDAYDGVYDEFPFLRVETGGVKPFACSNALSVLRFTGFYFPFTGEANVNMDSPVAWLAVHGVPRDGPPSGALSPSRSAISSASWQPRDAPIRCTATPAGWRDMSISPMPCTARTPTGAAPSARPCRRRCSRTCGRTTPTGRRSGGRCPKRRRVCTTRSSRPTATPAASAATAW